MSLDARRVRTFALVCLLLSTASFAEARADVAQACFKEESGPPSPTMPMRSPTMPSGPQAASAFAGPQAAFVENRWNSTAYDVTTGSKGDPVTVTWGVVDDGVTINAFFTGEGEVTSASNLRATLDALYGSEAVWEPILQEVFDTWDLASGVRFIHESADDGEDVRSSVSFKGSVGVRPDIRISGHAIDGDSKIVAYAYAPPNGDIVIDTSDAFFGNISQDSLRLRNALSHEVGHAMGLKHVCPLSQDKLMEPTVGTFLDGPQADDIRGMTENYGDTLESNDGSTSANDFQIGIDEGAAVLDLSIDASGDEDWIEIPDEPGIRVSVSAAPLDAPYEFNAEDTFDGDACDGGPGIMVETATAQDLAIELVAADGATSIVFRDQGASGDPEVITRYPVNGGGFIRLVGDGGSEPQIYDLLVEFVPEPGSSAASAAALMALAALRARARRRATH